MQFHPLLAMYWESLKGSSQVVRNQVTKLHFVSFLRAGNAIFPPPSLTAWEESFRDSLYIVALESSSNHSVSPVTLILYRCHVQIMYSGAVWYLSIRYDILLPLVLNQLS